jgi:hypothetical protein
LSTRVRAVVPGELTLASAREVESHLRERVREMDAMPRSGVARLAGG